MCGIAGIADRSRPADQYSASIEAMTDALRHRGPDGRGTEILRATPAIIFGHRRLAIIDLSPAGLQPMTDPETKNSITFNGEIYNFRELRRELEAQGQQFRTRTDTEVILKAYSAWGSDFIRHLRGIFAFALWDPTSEMLLIARDHLGVKPLYYCQDEHRLAFASEVRSLLSANLIEKRLDRRGLRSYLMYGSVQEPLTLVAGIQSLPPGHRLTWKNGDFSISRYWRLPPPEQIAESPPPGLHGQIEERLAEAVRLQLVSDVPLGAFLSGGIDSTAIAALAQAALNKPIKTFSIVFDETDYDERQFSRRAADYIGTDHAELQLSGHSVVANLPRALSSFDQPSVDGVNTYFVSKVTREAGLTVALSGVGGDEVFGGYDGYRKPLLMAQWGGRFATVPSAVRDFAAIVLEAAGSGENLRKAAALLRSPDEWYLISRQLYSENQTRNLLTPDALKTSNNWRPTRFGQVLAETAAYDPINRISALELLTYMTSTLLRDTDQMSMAHALEVRVPLIDFKLVEYLFSLPGDCKLELGQPKPLLTRPLNGRIPPECVHRTKRGFELPFAVWLREALREEVYAMLSAPPGDLAEVFDPAALRQLWKRFEEGRLSWSRIWSIFALLSWLDRHQIRA